MWMTKNGQANLAVTFMKTMQKYHTEFAPIHFSVGAGSAQELCADIAGRLREKGRRKSVRQPAFLDGAGLAQRQPFSLPSAPEALAGAYAVCMKPQWAKLCSSPLGTCQMSNGEKTMKDDGLKQWLAIRKEAGLHIDSNTAEVTWAYALTIDPYGVYPGSRDTCDQVGREYFARSPGANVWVWFGDLPKATRDLLWEKHKSKLAFPAGLPLWIFDN
jgi:hypothetical protein